MIPEAAGYLRYIPLKLVVGALLFLYVIPGAVIAFSLGSARHQGPPHAPVTMTATIVRKGGASETFGLPRRQWTAEERRAINLNQQMTAGFVYFVAIGPLIAGIATARLAPRLPLMSSLAVAVLGCVVARVCIPYLEQIWTWWSVTGVVLATSAAVAARKKSARE